MSREYEKPAHGVDTPVIEEQETPIENTEVEAPPTQDLEKTPDANGEWKAWFWACAEYAYCVINMFVIFVLTKAKCRNCYRLLDG